MKILAIDTSGLQASAAIISSYITIGEVFLNARTGEKSFTHSEILMCGVEQLFKLTRAELSEINYIAYTSGPGSFTGLRIGAACALGMARALSIPAIPVPTLDALAYNALGMGLNCLVQPMLDARRGQVYTATYRGERETDFLAMSVEELSLPDEKIFFLGDGAGANAEFLRKKFPNAIFASANNNRQRASSVALCAAEKISRGEKFSAEVELLYVRAPQAVREAEKKCSAS